MKFHLIYLILLVFISSCSEKGLNKNILKEDEICKENKSKAENAFLNKNYEQTIVFFENMQNCFWYKSNYYLKLALLNNDLQKVKEFRENLMLALDEVEKEEYPNKNDKNLSKAYLLALLEKNEDSKREISKIYKSQLSHNQKEALEFVELMVNKGEFISMNLRVEYELFD